MARSKLRFECSLDSMEPLIPQEETDALNAVKSQLWREINPERSREITRKYNAKKAKARGKEGDHK